MSTRKSRRKVAVCMVGAFPPPVCGLSLVSAGVRAHIIEMGVRPAVINVSAESLDRSWRIRISRVKVIVAGLIRFVNLIAKDRSCTVYVAISGGYGQLHEIAFVGLARLFAKRLFLHHHSYAYLIDRKWITRVLTSIAGSNTVHIVACEDMRRQLKSLYKAVRITSIVSGIAIIDYRKSKSRRAMCDPATIGFLSNISSDKGITEFLDIVARLQRKRVVVKALIAGPFQDAKTEEVVKGRLRKLNMAEYVGPKYGEDKSTFYRNIDVLIFPTKYTNESEGLVIHEAMSYAVPVITIDRGCIESIILDTCGLVVRKDQDFVNVALNQLLIWISTPEVYLQVSRNVMDRFRTLRTKADMRLKVLCSNMLNM